MGTLYIIPTYFIDTNATKLYVSKDNRIIRAKNISTKKNQLIVKYDDKGEIIFYKDYRGNWWDSSLCSYKNPYQNEMIVIDDVQIKYTKWDTRVVIPAWPNTVTLFGLDKHPTYNFIYVEDGRIKFIDDYCDIEDLIAEADNDKFTLFLSCDVRKFPDLPF